MEYIDENGKWLIENGVSLLIEPSNTWILTNQPEKTQEEKLSEIRIERNKLLFECDWTQLVDCVLSVEKKAEYITYRQALRDLPFTVNLNNIIYPIKP